MSLKKNIWAYGVIVATLSVVALCVHTVVVALDNKPVMDNAFFMSQKQLDRSYNDIIEASKQFDARFRVDVDASFATKKSWVELQIIDKTTQTALQAEIIKVVVTRPDDDKLDKDLKFTFEEGVYKSKHFTLEKQGRWQVRTKIKVQGLVKFANFEYYASP